MPGEAVAAETTAAPHFVWIKALCHKITGFSEQERGRDRCRADPFWTLDSRFAVKVNPIDAVKRSRRLKTRQNPTGPVLTEKSHCRRQKGSRLIFRYSGAERKSSVVGVLGRRAQSALSFSSFRTTANLYRETSGNFQIWGLSLNSSTEHAF